MGQIFWRAGWAGVLVEIFGPLGGKRLGVMEASGLPHSPLSNGGETLKVGPIFQTEKDSLVFSLRERGWRRPLPHFLISPTWLTLS